MESFHESLMSNEACTPSIALYDLNTIDCTNFLKSIQGCILFDVGLTYCLSPKM